jgi:hypothetical protein
MAYRRKGTRFRKKAGKTGRRLVKYGGKIITAGHAAKCVGKGFKGCSKTEITAVVEVVQRMAAAAKRRRS